MTDVSTEAREVMGRLVKEELRQRDICTVAEDASELAAAASAEIARLLSDLSAATKRAEAAEAVAARYSELIYRVGSKYPGETRHETALRYITQAEAITEDAARAAQEQQK